MARREIIIIVKEEKTAPAREQDKTSIAVRVNEFISLIFSLVSKILMLILIVVLVLWTVKEYRASEIVINKIQISPQLTSKGYDELYFITSMLDSINAITNTAKRKIAKKVSGTTDYVIFVRNLPHKRAEIKAEVLGTGMSVSQILEIFFEVAGLDRQRSLNCEVIYSGKKISGYVHVDPSPVRRVASLDKECEEVTMGKIVQEAAIETLAFTDPATLALYYYSVRNDKNKAINAARRLLNHDEKWALNFIGVMFNELRQYDSAIRYLEKAVAIDETFLSAYNNLGLAYFNSGRPNGYAEALKVFLRCVREDVDKTYKFGSYNAARTYFRLNAYDSAVFYYKESLKIDSIYVSALNNLAYTYRYKGHQNALFYDTAIKVIDCAFPVAKENKEKGLLWSTMAEITFDKGDIPTFYKYWEKAVALGYQITADDLSRKPYVDIEGDPRFKAILAQQDKLAKGSSGKKTQPVLPCN